MYDANTCFSHSARRKSGDCSIDKISFLLCSWSAMKSVRKQRFWKFRQCPDSNYRTLRVILILHEVISCVTSRTNGIIDFDIIPLKHFRMAINSQICNSVQTNIITLEERCTFDIVCHDEKYWHLCSSVFHIDFCSFNIITIIK